MTARHPILAAALALLAACATARGGAAPSSSGELSGVDPEVRGRILLERDLVARDPANRAAWVKLGTDYYDLHRQALAIEAYGRALELDPRDANVLSDLGVMYYELGEYPKAIAAFERAGEVDPRHQPSQLNLGTLYVRAEQPEKAAAAYRRVIEIAPEGATAQRAREALAALSEGKTALERISANLELVAREPGNRAAWVQLGNDYYDTEQPEKAIEAYGRALALDPRDADVLNDLGNMHDRVGAIEKALAAYEQAQRVDPMHVQSLFNLGVLHAERLKQPDRAAAAWRRVVELAPESPQAERARKALAGLEE
jgi:tetratricopeptide (TPR) repeat protein